jgi:transketolase
MASNKPNQDVFSETLLELAQNNRDILVVTSDSRGSAKLVKYGKTLPDQIIEVGIAEQNLVGVAAGLASAGKHVYAVSPACFVTARSLEQIKNDVAYSDRPVKVIGISAGVSYGALGSTHHSLHDYAVLRTINNIDIIAPADNFETRKAVEASVNHSRPIYMRLGKRAIETVHAPDASFEIGKAIVMKEGKDVTFVATGEPLIPVVQAVALLEQNGMSCGIISMHTIKPFDAEALLHAARHTRALITVEEHSVYGGLGERCASLLMEQGIHLPFKIVGFPDEHTVTGSQMEIFKHYGISADGLAQTARQLLVPEFNR